MQAAFEVGLASEQDPEVHKNSLVRDFEESLQWWLHTRPEVFQLLSHIPTHYNCRCPVTPPLHAYQLPRMSWL